MARIVITTTGSGGDLFPFIPVAQELRGRGHEVVVAAPPALLHLAGDEVGDSVPVGPFLARQAVRRHHAFDHRWWGYRGFDGFWQMLLESLARTTAELRPVVADADLVLTHVFHPAAVIAADAEATPLATLNLHPAFQPGPGRPPPGLPAVGGALDRLAWRALRSTWRRRTDPGINQVRAEHALPPMEDAALLGAVASRRSFDLVDPWYAGRDLHPDHDAPTVGYPRWEPTARRDATAIPEGEDPLVVVTLGTALPLDPGSFYDVFLEAISHLSVRAVVLGAGRREVPAELAGRVTCNPFVPLAQLLPHAALVVHHGGTGTSHAAVAHGCPSLVVPRCFDQRYQAARLVAVGAARTLRWRGLTAGRAADAIRAALSDPSLGDATRTAAASVAAAPSPAERLADAIQARMLVR